MDPCVSRLLLCFPVPAPATLPGSGFRIWLSAPACWVPSYSSWPHQWQPPAIGTTHSLAQEITNPHCPPLSCPLCQPVTSRRLTLSVSGLTLPIVYLRHRPLQLQAGKPWTLASVSSHAGFSTEQLPELGGGSLTSLCLPCYICVIHGVLFSTAATTKYYQLSVLKQHKLVAVL